MINVNDPAKNTHGKETNSQKSELNAFWPFLVRSSR